MPVDCPLEIRALTAEEFGELDYRIMAHAFACQNELGRLCDEGVYQRDLRARLLEDGFRGVSVEVPVSVSYMDFTKTYLLDIVVDNAVYELKTVTTISNEHRAQLLNYMFLLGVPRGKLLNFRSPRVQGQIHATSLTAEERYCFHVDSSRWKDLSEECRMLRKTVIQLLDEWGAFLHFRLYEQALMHFCGGETVMQRVPLCRGATALGTQPFLVHSAELAFRVTSVTDQVGSMEVQLRRLLSLTELRAIQWINCGHSNIQLTTIMN